VDDLKKQREKALAAGQTPKYNRACAALTKEQVEQNLKKGIPGVIRLRMPDNCDIE
jgi:nondiscriminating glutamyl-tRNA synthetase